MDAMPPGAFAGPLPTSLAPGGSAGWPFGFLPGPCGIERTVRAGPAHWMWTLGQVEWCMFGEDVFYVSADAGSTPAVTSLCHQSAGRLVLGVQTRQLWSLALRYVFSHVTWDPEHLLFIQLPPPWPGFS